MARNGERVPIGLTVCLIFRALESRPPNMAMGVLYISCCCGGLVKVGRPAAVDASGLQFGGCVDGRFVWGRSEAKGNKSTPCSPATLAPFARECVGLCSHRGNAQPP